MKDLLLAWIAFPLLLAALCIGCGRLVRALLPGSRLPDPLLAPVGFALLVVVGGFLTSADATAELATPAAVVLAGAGFVVGGTPRPSRALVWPLATAAAAFAVYAAPIVLSGEATFAGYIRLDDTATWMALTDRVMEHGRSLDDLAPSTYEATLAFNLADGYPVGAFLPLGIGRALVGIDVAWTIQPYMAFVAILLALSLYELGRRLVASRGLRAAAALIGALSALLFGYYLWGGVKEIVAAALIAAFAALAALMIRRLFEPASLVAAALTCAALAGALSVAGLVWLAPILAVLAVVTVRALGARTASVRAGTFVALAALLSIPVVIAGGLSPPTSAPLTSSDALGNLARPLEPSQLAGIWPAGDFRFEPDAGLLTAVLIAVALAAAAAALVLAWRRRAFGPALYVGGTLLACALIGAFASPWVDAKALATASPAIPFAAALTGGALWVAGRRTGGAALVAIVAAGVLWSNALAYRDVALAPRDQLAELETIGDQIAGEGPTLMTEYNPYGARHFLREADAESVSELRRRVIPRRNGEPVPKGGSADTDELSIPALLEYPTLVLHRSPALSRPPAPYELVAAGDSYEVWQRPAGPAPELDHLQLGDTRNPVARPRCTEVRALADRAGRSARLVAAVRPEPLVIPLSRADRPAGWPEQDRATVLPDGPGELRAAVRVPRRGRYGIWLGGSVGPEVEVSVDGRPSGSVRHVLNNSGQYVRLGTAELGPGLHAIVLRFGGADLHPGSGASAGAVGPLTLSPSDAASARLESVRAGDATRLCGRAFDWIEVR